ncbi:SAM-dependent methyltransferase [Williamsia sterculiae]|uniref:Nodulation protein S (NodS) n=1 Tax=Williamsia sterculiae TaxID=1344003 RepID=A0A1N7G9A3_9NOCA|nr:class I SAM-dependent methyltransferase [Williamsia sterculiae]SIS09056.1 Nodulation protein S (NodS) [Williamsia sterculiae]
MDPDYFRKMYHDHDDPWGFTDRWYEHRKVALTTALLPRSRYGRGLEIGSSIGVLSAELARRCDGLLCLELEPRAAELAAERVRSFGDRVHIRVTDFFADRPAGPFDLIVLSEVLYYASADQLAATVDWLPVALAAGGAVIAVHWRHPVAEYPLTGDQVHDTLTAGGLAVAATYQDADLRADVLIHPQTPSVAADGGLV